MSDNCVDSNDLTSPSLSDGEKGETYSEQAKLDPSRRYYEVKK